MPITDEEIQERQTWVEEAFAKAEAHKAAWLRGESEANYGQWEALYHEACEEQYQLAEARAARRSSQAA